MDPRTRLPGLCLAAVGALVLSACSGSSHSAAATARASSAAAAQTSAAGQAPSPSTSNAANASTASDPTTAGPANAASTPGLAAKGCGAVKLKDVQPLVKATVAKIEFDPGSAELDATHSFECMVDNPTLTIAIHPEDSTKATYTEDVAAENVPAVPLPGVGDVAVWTAVSLTAGSYTSAPNIYAHRGTVTCEVQVSGTGLTIPSEPGVAASVTQANAAAFAAKLGVLCNDVFAAIS